MTSLPNSDFRSCDAGNSPAVATAGPCCCSLPVRLGREWLNLPSAAWTRILVLFFALALIKLVLLAGLSKHLYEIHWRVGGSPVTWINYVGFFAFLLLGTLSLFNLASRCRSVGVKAVRTANATVLVLGLSFIFLTFHNGNRNYIYPILDGTLKWQSLGPYLALDLFFHPPFLAAWLLGYAFVYYLLARTGRETWMLYVTASCAAVYGLLFLPDLMLRRNELLIADCLGLVSVAMAWGGPSRKLHHAWLLLPLAWSVFFAWALLRLGSGWFGRPLGYFGILLGATFILFGLATFLAYKQGYVAPWNNFILFLFTAFLLLTNRNYLQAENYGNLLCLALTFPRYFAGELVLVTILAFGASLHCKLQPRAGLWWLDLLGLVMIVWAFVDLRLSQIMGVRLEWDLLAFGNSPKMMWRMSRPYLPVALAGLGIMALLYVLVLRVVERWHRRKPPATTVNSPGQGLTYIAATFVALAALGVAVAEADKGEGQAALRLVQTSPLWKRVASRALSRDEFLGSARALGLGDFAPVQAIAPAQAQRDLNVVLIFQESSYNKYLSLFDGNEETQPLLSKYKDRMELFPNFFSSFAGSIHARFATLTSLYPSRDFNAFTLQRVNVKSLFEVLHENGYTCSLFYSSFFDYTGFRDFLKGRHIDEMYDADTMPGQRTARVAWGLREEATLEAIRGQIKKYASGDRRFFLTYVPAAPHYPYDNIPKAFQKYKMTEFGDYTPLYLNELLFMDWIIASILDQLKESGQLDRTLVIITNDHGEMLGGKNSCVGHGWAITPELANTPLIVMDPQHPGYQLNYSIGSQIDLLPTILDRLNIPVPSDQLYEGRSLYATGNQAGRLVYLNSLQQFGILAGNRIILGDRQTKNGSLAVADRKVYAISNQGSKTIFTGDSEAECPAVSIRQFDEFQESFLRNYSAYCAALCKDAHLAVRR